MIKLKIKLALFNLFSKLIFTALFLIFLPYIIERINLRQVDKELIQKREQVIDIIAEIGIEPFITSDSTSAFGSYNILKEEFVSLEKVEFEEDLNYIEVSQRLIEEENIFYRVLNYTFEVDGEKYLIEIGKSLSSIFTARQNISKVILVFLAFIIIITLLTDLQYTRRILRPLDEISKKLGNISNPASFDKVPVNTNTSDFHQLDEALIKIMNHIDGLFQKEKEITVNISHELLTPISIIRSKLENILLRSDHDHEISEKIEESLKTLQRLHSLVNSLLFIARIESLQYLRDDSFTVNDVLRDIIEELKPIAEDASVNLHSEFDKDYFIVNANRSLIFSMFFNVVNNAVKNTPVGGSVIAYSTIQEDSRFVVKISDTGKGMTEDQITNLFSRFKTRKVTDGTGSGIGLAIAKTIADLHKIEITVSTKSEKGATFSFIFS